MYTEDNIEYVRGRLVDTLVRDVDGDPFYVVSIHSTAKGFQVEGYYPAGDDDYVMLPFKRLNLEPVPLGYVNIPRQSAVYMERKPVRNDWRQGMRANNTYVIGHKDYMDISLKDISLAILGVYPGFEEASASKKVTGFCRAFAADDKSLYYKGEVVGDIKDGLFPKYTYLREFLEEMVSENP